MILNDRTSGCTISQNQKAFKLQRKNKNNNMKFSTYTSLALLATSLIASVPEKADGRRRTRGHSLHDAEYDGEGKGPSGSYNGEGKGSSTSSDNEVSSFAMYASSMKILFTS
jgi:hypothetical protein